MSKLSLWELLIDKGFFTERKTATSWILSGKVIVDGEAINQAGTRVSVKSDIKVKGIEAKYVGKGGMKLEGALKDFNIDVTDKVTLDSGASTGGFTDCLIQSGAKKVYAIDVGYGQLAGKLRNDPKVKNMEKTNLGNVDKSQLEPTPSLAVLDLSYLSLKKAVPLASELLVEEGEIVALIKPLFEIEDSEIRRSGVIKDLNIYEDLLFQLYDYFTLEGFSTLGITVSPITGNSGTIEYFIHLTKINNLHNRDKVLGDIDIAIKKTLSIPKYEKKR